ncbi:MAG: diguanylate cyclase [Clostridiales bacterium]|nr:diguanylate cyclase [Clostridiales bacterium]
MPLSGQNRNDIVIALEMMFDGVAYVDRNGCILSCDEKIESMFMPIDGKGHLISDDDVRQFGEEPQLLNKAVQRSISEQKLIILDEVHLTQRVFYECRIAPYRKGALVLLSDVTARRMEKERLAESERSKEMVLANLPGMAYRCKYDREWTMLYVSEGCYDLTGYKPESLVGNEKLAFNDIINPGYREIIWNDWKKAVEEKRIYRGEYPITKVTGESVWVYEQGQAIYGEDGEVEALEGLIIDVTARKDKEKQIEYLLTHDTLTGAYNRRYYIEKKDALEFDETVLPISIIIGDIDGLKLINDAFGTEKGDTYIAGAARIIAKCIREQDIFARLGGDDFAILLPNTDAGLAQSILASIEEAFRTYNATARHDFDQIYMTFGFATKDMADISLDSVRKLAEENMNKGKLLQRKSLHSAIVESIKETMSARSRETEDHSERLADLTREVGLRMHLNQVELSELELLATLHDIGKIGINDDILNKPGKLTDEEWAQMRRHTEIGYKIAMASPELVPIADYILTHHERWDGKGYPQGLSKEQIPLISRILSVVDAYDAMTQDRPYRKAMSKEVAVKELVTHSGSQFDPAVVRVFLNIIGEPNSLDSK